MTYDVAAIRVRLDDPLAVARALGLIDGPASYRRGSRGIKVRCPAHSERTPSCWLTSSGDGVTWHCFGCGAGGGVLGLVAAVAGLDCRGDFRRVVELAAQMAGVEEGTEAPHFAPPPRPPEPPRLDDAVFDAIARVIERRCPVAGEPDVAGYVAARGFDAATAAALAALPGDARGREALIDAIVAEVGREAWLCSGLATDDGGMLFAHHRLVAFWRAPDGIVQTLQRRVIHGGGEPRYVFATRRKPRYPYGVEHAASLGPGGEVAFCEGFLDALALRSLSTHAGYDRLVLGLPGVAGWTAAWAPLAAGRTALVATDADAAGESAAQRLAADLYAAGAHDVHRLTPEGAGDWTDALTAREVAA